MPMGIGLGIGVTRGGGAANLITAIFADGTDGFYFDFSKTDRLFQEAQGAATPADGAGENIGTGLESHAWNGLEVAALIAAAAELRANGTIGIIGTATAATYNTSTGAGTVTRVDVVNQSFVSLPTTAGLGYYLDIEAVETILIRNGGSGAANLRAVSPGERVQLRMFPGSTSLVITSSAATVAFTVHSFKLIPGNHGLQATTAAQPKWQTGGLARFDGSDDNLLTTLVPGAAMTYMAKVKISNISFWVAMGSRGAADTRSYLSFDGTGKFGGGVGTHNNTTIVGGPTFSVGNVAVAAVTYDGTTVKLYVNGVEVYSGAQSGVPTTTIATILCAFNDNGTPGSFLNGDTYHALAIKKALTAAQIAAITNLWGTT